MKYPNPANLHLSGGGANADGSGFSEYCAYKDGPIIWRYAYNSDGKATWVYTPPPETTAARFRALLLHVAAAHNGAHYSPNECIACSEVARELAKWN